tara:strand:- start:51350 stop:52162 length:813 start_codon:yes stop_codon:yes gene_type:complete
MSDKTREFLDLLENRHDLVRANSVMDHYDSIRDVEDKDSAEENILKNALKTDPLGEAEKEIGAGYNDPDPLLGDAVTALGMKKMWENQAVKDEILKKRKDTLFRNTKDYYLAVIEENGFEKVLEIPFVSHDKQETYFVYWHPDGLLLSFDTFNEDGINGGKIKYNWTANDWEKMPWGILSSHAPFKTCQNNGEEIEYISGDHDAREALIYNMDQLREHGTFLSPWKEQGFLWLLHHGDTKDEVFDYQAITEERIKMLPQHVQDAIKGEED